MLEERAPPSFNCPLQLVLGYGEDLFADWLDVGRISVLGRKELCLDCLPRLIEVVGGRG